MNRLQNLLSLPISVSRRLSHTLLSLLASATLFLQSACFDPQYGCLDIAATNFNASADKNCCCNFPDLILVVDQVYGTELYRPDSLVVGTNGHLFKIKSIAFYLSEFQCFKGTDRFEVGDSLDLKTLAGTDTVSRNFINDFVLSRITPRNVVGSFREDGNFDKVRFRLGLNSEAGTVLPTLAPSGHPLALQADSLYQNEYVFMQVVVARDSMTATPADTLRFTRADLGDYFIEGTGTFNHAVGYDFNLRLQADWQALFEGVVWTVYDKQAWKSRIVANLPSVFSVSQ
jgi:hypothetical protein